MERAGKPRHRWANPRGRESGSERVNGISDIEGKVAREAMSECGQRASFNAANGMSDMAGKAARQRSSVAGATEIQTERYGLTRNECQMLGFDPDPPFSSATDVTFQRFNDSTLQRPRSDDASPFPISHSLVA